MRWLFGFVRPRSGALLALLVLSVTTSLLVLVQPYLTKLLIDDGLIARQFEWWPILELENGKQYRFHIGSTDVQHGFSLQPVNINLQIHPGYEMVLTAEPNKTGEFPIICNEYCGLGHHLMVGRVNVVEPQ